MKSTSFLVALATAAMPAFGLTLGKSEWHRPDAWPCPSEAKVSFITSMGNRDGGAELGIQQYSLSIQMADPRKSAFGDWRLGAALEMEYTFLDTNDPLMRKHESLLDVSFPLVAIRQFNDDRSLMLGVSPNLSGDLDSDLHSLDFAAMAVYNVKLSETFSYSYGLAFSPRFSEYYVIPVFGFNWQMAPRWELSLKGTELTAYYEIDDKLKAGPFVSAEGNNWVVENPAGARIFRVESLVAGLTAEYAFDAGDGGRNVLKVSVGSSILTRASYSNRGNHDTVTDRHYDPGFFFSVGYDYRF